jgi:hypothetical protein
MKPITIVNAFRHDEKPVTFVDIKQPFGRHTTHISLGMWRKTILSYKIRVKTTYPIDLLPSNVIVEKLSFSTGKDTYRYLYEIRFAGEENNEKTNLLIKYIDQVGEYHERRENNNKRKWNRVNMSEWLFPASCIEESLLEMFRPKVEQPVVDTTEEELPF